MLTLLFVLVLTSLSAAEHTRVNRIRASNAHPESTRYTSAGKAILPQTDEASNRSSTVHSVMNSKLTAITSPRSTFCEKAYTCTNCTTFRLCIPSAHGYVELLSGPCPRDRPYCDNYSGTCVSSVLAAVQCGESDKSFRCMRDGHFPHPVDAAKYYICSDLKAYGYSCKEGYKYYAPSKECSKFSWISTPFDCSDLNATKVLYNNGGSFFAYCVDGQPLVVSNCAENEFFNSTTQVCEPQCNQEVIAPDSNNCVKYFKCLKNSTTHLYDKISLTCPDGEGFSYNIKKCVSLKQLPNCKSHMKLF